jgi:hypothetical protein
MVKLAKPSQVIPDLLDLNEVKKNDGLFFLLIKKLLIFLYFLVGNDPRYWDRSQLKSAVVN